LEKRINAMAQDGATRFRDEHQMDGGSSLDLLDQNLTIAEVLQHDGQGFDMAVDEVLDGLSLLRTSLDKMMMVTMGSDLRVSGDMVRQLQRATCACHRAMTGVQEELLPFLEKMHTLLKLAENQKGEGEDEAAHSTAT
jgi:hypothetical protein